MHEPLVTLSGNVGTVPELVEAADTVVAKFRVACTPRLFSKQDEEWVDGDTQWYAVNAWRRLGENVAESLRLGDPVLVHGKLSATAWTNKSGITVTSFEVDALMVGHDLSRGTATFVRPDRSEAAPRAAEPVELTGAGVG